MGLISLFLVIINSAIIFLGQLNEAHSCLRFFIFSHNYGMDPVVQGSLTAYVLNKRMHEGH